MQDIRLKKIKIRCWRRGTKEMDLVLGRYADANLTSMSSHELDHFEDLLAEEDVNIMSWINQQIDTPLQFKVLVDRLRAYAIANPL
ncbi:MAG: succinate dehydrogenase assembly factor 2 [Pseudomonadota bacterium]